MQLERSKSTVRTKQTEKHTQKIASKKIKDKLPPYEREMMVNLKRQYITRLDHIRRNIRNLEKMSGGDDKQTYLDRLN